MSILGRGLESLIPKKNEAPDEPAALDVLHGQAGLTEPVYRFYEHDVVVETASAAPVRARPVPASSPVPGSDERNIAVARREESIFWIEVAKIEPNPHQPRQNFDVGELTSLADSIREHGMLQPVLVTKIELDSERGLAVRYQLIAGERRWRAAKIIGMREVPAIIRASEIPEREKLELALIENVQREDLNPLERARAFARLVDEFGLMQKEVANRIGKSREVVANALRMLRLPEEIQSAIGANLISEGHARALLMLEHDAIAQKNLFQQIRTLNFSVRETELTARAVGGNTTRGRRRGIGKTLDPDARELQRQLEEAFGTKVLLMKKGEQGKIVVEFYSDEELQRILDRVTKREEGYI